MTEPITGHLRVDGATLHYEVRGSGPLLLLIPGGAGDAASVDGIADDLATGYTVASYDPRGMSRTLRRNPSMSMSLIDDTNPLRYLVLRGRLAEVVDDPGGDFYVRLGRRYGNADQQPPPDKADRVILVMSVEQANGR